MFLVGNKEHTTGDNRCVECYTGYPHKCRCGGLIHAEFVDKSWNGDLNIKFLCDQCGDQFKELAPRQIHKKIAPRSRTFPR